MIIAKDSDRYMCRVGPISSCVHVWCEHVKDEERTWTQTATEEEGKQDETEGG